MSNDESLIEFPCSFPVKAVGKSGDELHTAVLEIMSRHVPDLDESMIRHSPSKAGNYTSVTVVVQAQSRQQMDAIYQDLTACEHVIMAL